MAMWDRFLRWLGVREVSFAHGGSSGELPVVKERTSIRVVAMRAVVDARFLIQQLTAKRKACNDALEILERDGRMVFSQEARTAAALAVVDMHAGLLRKRRLTHVLWKGPDGTFVERYHALMHMLREDVAAHAVFKSAGGRLGSTQVAHADERGQQAIDGADVTGIVSIVNAAKKDLAAMIVTLDRQIAEAEEKERRESALADLG